MKKAAKVLHSSIIAQKMPFEIAYGVMVAVTVGDDTTAIAGEILARMGIIVVVRWRP
jgi:hypothetical protein